MYPKEGRPSPESHDRERDRAFVFVNWYEEYGSQSIQQIELIQELYLSDNWLNCITSK
jgi:hypothetical protein